VARRIIAILCVLAVGGGIARAEPSEAEASASARKVLIALRILAYDKTLAERSPADPITIAVAGRRERALWLAGFARLPKVKVGGRAIRVIALDFESEKQFAAAIATHAPAALIVGSDIEANLAAIKRVTRARRTLTMTTQESAVRSGLAVGLIPGRERDEIVINIDAARAEGVRFGAGLLQLARIVDEAP
jgi:hypothetical protein